MKRVELDEGVGDSMMVEEGQYGRRKKFQNSSSMNTVTHGLNQSMY